MLLNSNPARNGKVILSHLLNLPTYCDSRLGDNESINFNAGMHTRSINLAYVDYLAVEKPTLGIFRAKSTT